MGVPLAELLILAGHFTQEEYENPIGQTDLARLYEVGDLSDEEWHQVLEFARYVRSKRNASQALARPRAAASRKPAPLESTPLALLQPSALVHASARHKVL